MDKGKIYNALTFPSRKIASLIDTPAVVLLYHRVKSLPSDPLQLAVTPQHFEEHIKYLKSAYNLISIEEFSFHKKNKKKFSEKTVLVTFDDGYEDNCNEALPVLEKYKAQALFFITTSNLNTARENWWDDLERIFLEGEKFPSELRINRRENEIRLKTSTLEERRNAYWSLQPVLKFTKPVQRNDLMRQLHSWRGISDAGRPTHRMMTTDELKKLASSESAVIGAHTHSHASLGNQIFEEQLSEIKKSKEFLEELTGKKIIHFAYPFGTRKDFNNDTIKVCENLDLVGFANYYGQVHRWTNNYRIPRMLVRDWDLETFKKKMNSFFNY